jgi:hypothetical protein
MCCRSAWSSQERIRKDCAFDVVYCVAGVTGWILGVPHLQPGRAATTSALQRPSGSLVWRFLQAWCCAEFVHPQHFRCTSKKTNNIYSQYCATVCSYTATLAQISASRYDSHTLYIYVCVYTYVYVCMYICMCVCSYVCVWMCMYVCMHICLCLRRYVYMYVCIYLCMYVCMCLLSKYMNVSIYVSMYVYMCVCVYVCMYECMYVRICLYVCMYVCVYACVYVCMYVRMCLYVGMYVCVCLCMYIYM